MKGRGGLRVLEHQESFSSAGPGKRLGGNQYAQTKIYGSKVKSTLNGQPGDGPKNLTLAEKKRDYRGKLDSGLKTEGGPHDRQDSSLMNCHFQRSVDQPNRIQEEKEGDEVRLPSNSFTQLGRGPQKRDTAENHNVG